jgi:hypothetical protein
LLLFSQKVQNLRSLNNTSLVNRATPAGKELMQAGTFEHI